MAIFPRWSSRTIRSFVSNGVFYHVIVERARINNEPQGSVLLIDERGVVVMGRATPPDIDQVATFPLPELLQTIFGVVPHAISEEPPSSPKIKRWTLWSPVYQRFCALTSWVSTNRYYDLTFFSAADLTADRTAPSVTISVDHQPRHVIHRLLNNHAMLFEDLYPMSTTQDSDTSSACALNLIYRFPRPDPSSERRPTVIMTPAGANVALSYLNVSRINVSLPSLLPWADLHQTLRDLAYRLNTTCLLPFMAGDQMYLPYESRPGIQRRIDFARYRFTPQRRALAVISPSLAVYLDPPSDQTIRLWMEDPIAMLTEAVIATGVRS